MSHASSSTRRFRYIANPARDVERLDEAATASAIGAVTTSALVASESPSPNSCASVGAAVAPGASHGEQRDQARRPARISTIAEGGVHSSAAPRAAPRMLRARARARAVPRWPSSCSTGCVNDRHGESRPDVSVNEQLPPPRRRAPPQIAGKRVASPKAARDSTKRIDAIEPGLQPDESTAASRRAARVAAATSSTTAEAPARSVRHTERRGACTGATPRSAASSMQRGRRRGGRVELASTCTAALKDEVAEDGDPAHRADAVLDRRRQPAGRRPERLDRRGDARACAVTP